MTDRSRLEKFLKTLTNRVIEVVGVSGILWASWKAMREDPDYLYIVLGCLFLLFHKVPPLVFKWCKVYFSFKAFIAWMINRYVDPDIRRLEQTFKKENAILSARLENELHTLREQIKPLLPGASLPPITGTANVTFPSITLQATGTVQEKTTSEKILEERRKKLKETQKKFCEIW